MDDYMELFVAGKPNSDKGKGLWYLAVACAAQEKAGLMKWVADPKVGYTVELNFQFIKPKSTRKRQHDHIVKPDLTRLEITTLKAMEHIIFPDVKNLVRICKVKRYVEAGIGHEPTDQKEGALIRIWRR